MASQFQLTAEERLNDFNTRLREGGLEYLGTGPYKTAMHTAELEKAFEKTNTSYSGTDCTVIAVINEYMLVIGNASTISASVHREKLPVRVLGHTYPKNFTYGSRTIAGHLIFCTFDEHPLAPLFNFFNKRTSTQHRYSSPLSDDLPPIDLILLFNNESGSSSVMRIYGVEFQDDGYVVSINDIYSETSMQWVARDIDPMISAGEQQSWKRLIFEKQLEGKVIDEYYASLLQYKARLASDISIYIEQITNLNRNKLAVASAGNRLLDGQPAKQEHQGLIEDPSLYIQDRQNGTARQARQEQIKLKSLKLANLQAELNALETTILNYETKKMSWDHNAAIEGSPNDARFGPAYTS